MISKGAKLAVLVSLVCVARSFCQEPPPRAKPIMWQGDLSLGFAPTFFHVTYGDGDCWVNGFAFSCDYRGVYKPNGFCMAVKMAIGGVGANADVPDEYNTEDFTINMGDLKGWNWWASYTIGKCFEHGAFSFTPTAGIGTSLAVLEGNGKMSYPYYAYHYNYELFAIQLALCADLAFDVMFTDKVGISSSLLVALSLFGSVSETVDVPGIASATEDYSLEAGCITFIPSFYLIIRF